MVNPLPQTATRLLRYQVHLGSLTFSSATGIGCTVAGVAAIGGLVYWLKRRGPTAEQRETARRLKLAAIGRIVDGTVTDAIPSERDPSTIVYEYRIGGVTYECGQDVSSTSLHRYIGEIRIDLPVQVRYDPYNPGNSIVVAESWNGLWHWSHHSTSHGEESAD